MAVSPLLTPVAVILELAICILGIYAGYARNKMYGYLFAVTFLLFAAYDGLGQIGIADDILSILNLVAILAALVGMYLALQEC